MALYYLVATVFGLIVGSFANVVIYRVPLHKSIAYPPSHCPECGERIAWYDNVPIVSYVVLGTRCRKCGKPIAAQYPMIEAFCGLLFLWSAYTYGQSLRAAVAAAFLVTLLILAMIDVDHRVLPNVIVLPLMGFGAVIVAAGFALRAEVLPLVSSSALTPWPSAAARALLGFALGGGILLLLALVYRGGMGGGDIKLMAAIGLFLGPYVLFDLFVGVLLGSISGIYLIAVKGRSRKDLIPFGPFLVIGAYATLLWGEQVVGAYLKLVGFA